MLPRSRRGNEDRLPTAADAVIQERDQALKEPSTRKKKRARYQLNVRQRDTRPSSGSSHCDTVAHHLQDAGGSVRAADANDDSGRPPDTGATIASTSDTLPWRGGGPGLQDLDDPGGDPTNAADAGPHPEVRYHSGREEEQRRTKSARLKELEAAAGGARKSTAGSIREEREVADGEEQDDGEMVLCETDAEDEGNWSGEGGCDVQSISANVTFVSVQPCAYNGGVAPTPPGQAQHAARHPIPAPTMAAPDRPHPQMQQQQQQQQHVQQLYQPQQWQQRQHTGAGREVWEAVGNGDADACARKPFGGRTLKIHCATCKLGLDILQFSKSQRALPSGQDKKCKKCFNREFLVRLHGYAANVCLQMRTRATSLERSQTRT
jgi:hypothetical protein